MDDDDVLNAIIAACIVGIGVVLFLILTTDNDEAFTELYLLDYEKAVSGDVVAFEYGIGNYENRGMNYTVVTVIDDETVRSEVINVLDNGVYTDEYFFAVDESVEHKVVVRLLGRGEEVHFFTEVR